MRLSQSTNLLKVALVAGLGFELGGFISYAYALEGDVIRPYASATYVYDDNMRRFSSGQRAQQLSGSSKLSDTMLMTGVGIILDKHVSQQRFFADINLNRSKFDRNSDLDNDGKEITGRWDWKVGTRWDGKIELYHKEAMVPFSDFRVFNSTELQLNRRTSDRRLFEAKWMFHPRWRARVAFVNLETQFSAEVRRIANLEENSQELALDYLSPSKSIVGLVYRHARGVRPEQFSGFYGGFISNNYDQDELKLNVDWTVTGQSKLQILGGVVKRRHDQLSQRDFTGVNARGNYSWQPTGKTDVRLALWREHNAQSFVTSSYSLNKGSSLAVSWLATGKVIVQSSLKYEVKNFEGDPDLQQIREFKDKNIALSLIYNPIQSFRISAALTHSDRSANQDIFEFKSNSLSLTGQYEF